MYLPSQLFYFILGVLSAFVMLLAAQTPHATVPQGDVSVRNTLLVISVTPVCRDTVSWMLLTHLDVLQVSRDSSSILVHPFCWRHVRVYTSTVAPPYH